MVASIDRASSTLINFGVQVVRRNPIKMGFWVVGLLLGFLAQGTQVRLRLSCISCMSRKACVPFPTCCTDSPPPLPAGDASPDEAVHDGAGPDPAREAQ